MKKLLAILVVVLLVVCCCTLFACNNSNDDVEPQVIDVDTPDVDQSLNTVSGSYAWEKIKQAALNNSPSTGGYLNFNHILGFDFKKNGDGNHLLTLMKEELLIGQKEQQQKSFINQ